MIVLNGRSFAVNDCGLIETENLAAVGNDHRIHLTNGFQEAGD